MNLGFYYFVPAVKDSDKILLPGYFGRFLDCLANNCEELVLFLHCPNPDRQTHVDYQIRSDNVKLISLPPSGSVPNRIIHANLFTKEIRIQQKDLDAFLIRGPAPLLPKIGLSLKIPTILLLVGDFLAAVDTLPQPWWRKELIRLFWQINNILEARVARKSLVFVNSQVLYEQYEDKAKQLNLTHTTTLNSEDFYLRKDTCLSQPIRLLYAGRMDPAKGLLDMVRALAILNEQGEDVVLDMVGWSAKTSTINDEIMALAEARNVSDRVFLHGYKPVGPELFKYYKDADIYVLASQSSFEGFPRTIWEAMAHSLPVVATKVGSIPDFISGAAELVDPMKPKELAEGIFSLIHDSQKRQDIIKKGLALAHKNTLENQVGEMVDIIKQWINHR